MAAPVGAGFESTGVVRCLAASPGRCPEVCLFAAGASFSFFSADAFAEAGAVCAGFSFFSAFAEAGAVCAEFAGHSFFAALAEAGAA